MIYLSQVNYGAVFGMCQQKSAGISVIGNRIREERERLGLTQPQFADAAGAAKRTLIEWEKGSTSPTAVQLSALYTIGVDTQYILTGQKADSGRVNEHYQNYHNRDYTEIPHYDVRVAAGTGAINPSEERLKPLAFRKDWLVSRHLSPTNLVVVDVKGDSMEPKLLDGDLVLVDTSKTEITNGKTYVLRMDGHLFVKNLQLLPHGLIQVASFNQGFPPYQIDLSDESLDMVVIGRVVASMHEWV